MPGGAGRARRACGLCKPYKTAGNGRGWDSRRPHSEERRAPATTKAERRREAEDMAEDFYEEV